MMLNAFLPDIKQRYAFAGAAVGAVLPVSFYALDLIQGSSSSFIAWALSSPSQCTLAAMPFWAGLVGLQLGRSRSAERAMETARRKQEAQLLYAATHDPLTGLGNRTALDRHARALTSETALLLLDLDRFKFVNDTMGHDVGDELLVHLGQRLTTLNNGRFEVYRLGGDEFVVLLSGNPAMETVEALCKKIEALFVEPFDLTKGPASLGVSIGVAFGVPGERWLTDLLKQADLALYRAKEIPGNAHVHYEPFMAEEALARTSLERDLARAIENQEIVLEYQPILGAASRAVRAFEALVRWQHPERGLLLEEEFSATAEKTGLNVRLGRYVLRQACAEATKWPAPTGVAVNISGDQFRDPRFAEFVRECLNETGLSPGRLTIEITESVFALELSRIKQCLEELKEIGVRIALDDFGASFSSVNNLRQFPMDQLKLDKTFAKSMLSDDKGTGLMDIMLRFGSTLKVATAIEGIEDENQMDFVRERGASEVQGYLFSEPVPAEKVSEYIERMRGGRDSAAA